MEVKNPMMDQLLVNTAAPSPANQGAKAPKDGERPDFDSMVNQKRAGGEKTDEKVAKPAKQDAKAAQDDGKAEAAEQVPVSDEQYAIAAAMMFQAQPDMRVTQVQGEAVEIVPEAVAETAAPEQATVDAVQAETPEVQQTVVAEQAPQLETVAETAAPEEPVPVQTVQAHQTVEHTEDTPVEAKPEAPVETAKEPHPEHTEQTAQPQEARTEEAKTPETQRVVRNERPVETDEKADDTQAAAQEQQAAPVFAQVDAPVVKVAEAPRAIPLAEPDGAEQLGKEIGDVLVNNVEANRVEITLTPENLGKLTVEIARNANGTLSVVLHPSTERAANLLERHTGSLQNALAGSARSDVEVEVRPSDDSRQQFLDPNGQNRQQQQQQQQQQDKRREEQHSAESFLQQLRLGLVDPESDNG